MNILDTAVLILYFGMLIVVGIIGVNKVKSENDFLLAGSRMGYFTHVGCLAAVIIGGAATLGSTTLGYDFGISGFWFVTMMGVGIAGLGIFLVKKITGYEVFTISQLLGKRYGEGTQLISATVTAIYTLMVVVTQVNWNGKCNHVLLGWWFNFEAYWWRDRTLLYDSRRYVEYYTNRYHSICGYDDWCVFYHVPL